jgi:hypothetical protein
VPIYLTAITSVEQAFAWTDPGGTRHVLGFAGSGYDVLTGLRGRWMPPATPVEDEISYIPGSVLRDVNVRPLDFPLPILVSGESAAQLHQRLRDLMYWFSPGRGDGIFESRAPDGTTRLLNCRAREIDLVEEWPQRSETTQQVIVSLHAADPYWYADADETATWSQNFGLPSPPFPVTFPWLFPSNILFAAATVDNPGQVESWPTWLIVGPGSNPSLRNVTTGETMVFGRTLGLGESILVELSRDAVNITDGLGTKLFSTLSNPSVAWAIQPGINQIQVGMAAATSASYVTMAYRPKFLGP